MLEINLRSKIFERSILTSKSLLIVRTKSRARTWIYNWDYGIRTILIRQDQGKIPKFGRVVSIVMFVRAD